MTDPPVILGVKCEWCGDTVPHWLVRFGGLTVTIYPPTDGLWGRRVWQWRVGDSSGGSHDVKESAFADIERELLAIRAAIPEDPAVELARKARFQKSIQQVRESILLVSRSGVDLCVFGCKRMVKEGCRSYFEVTTEVDGKCPKCGLPRWHKGTDP